MPVRQALTAQPIEVTMSHSQERTPFRDSNLKLARLALSYSILLAAMMAGSIAQAQTMTVLYSFASAGYQPWQGLNMVSNGRMYGTTLYGGDLNCDGGGPAGCGVVFKFAKAGSGWIYSPLYYFNTQYSAFPMDPGVPTVAPDGSVYDVTFLGGEYDSNGMIFSLRPSATRPRSANSLWNFNSVYQFMGLNDGGNPTPQSPLVFDAHGNFYGTAGGGGTYNYGVVYEFTPSGDSWTENVLYNFTGFCDGAYPNGIVFDNAGNMYGTTGAGGTGSQCGVQNGCGTIFELSPTQSGWTETTLYAFRKGIDGCPSSPLYRDSAGNLYGISLEGGPDNNGGTVWELSPSNGSWTFNVLHAFNFETSGFGGPYPPTLDSHGTLWGTINAGGANQTGELFKLTQSNGSWTFTDVVDFAPRGGGAPGCYPVGSPQIDSSGNLYGGAQMCGDFDGGTIWEYTP